MEDRISVSIEDGVADVRLVRADKMNALDFAMFDALTATCDRLKTEKGLRAVVLAGEGRAFCAGLDTSRFEVMKEGKGSGRLGSLVPRTRGVVNDPQYAVWGWRELPVPVIAAVLGFGLGGGFQLMMGAELRLLGP